MVDELLKIYTLKQLKEFIAKRQTKPKNQHKTDPDLLLPLTSAQTKILESVENFLRLSEAEQRKSPLPMIITGIAGNTRKSILLNNKIIKILIIGAG